MSRVIEAFAQFFDDAGNPLEDGWLQFLVSNTTSTAKNTYSDEDLLIANPNPVQLDGAGRCPSVFGSGEYRVISYHNNPVTKAPGAQIQIFDPVIVPGTSSGGGSTGEARNVLDPDDGTWQGETTLGVAGESMVATDKGRPMCCYDTGTGVRWYFYNPDSLNPNNYTYLPTAILLTSAVVTAGDSILLTNGQGVLALDSLAGVIAQADVGLPLFAATGGVSKAIPSGAGDVIQQVGTILNRAANARDVFNINFSYPAVKRQLS